MVFAENGRKEAIFKKGPGYAFGNRVAKVYTTLQNKRATDAFALPARCTALASVGDPILEEKARQGWDVYRRRLRRRGVYYFVVYNKRGTR